MKDIIIDTLIDTLKLLPFLFVAFLLIELLEHKITNKTKKTIQKSGKFGPIFGSLLGLIPQCGFSVVATNLYITRIITVGTLLSIYLSCSDEMLPILLSKGSNISIIIKILITKFIIGMISGFIIDLFIKNKEENIHYDICKEEHCHCEEGILKSSLIHTFKISLFILIITFLLNCLFTYGLENYIYKIFNKNLFITPFITSLLGFNPSCASSVIITELYFNNLISFASMISGLLTGSGVAILILFKSNKNIKENLKILSILYLIGVLSGIIIELLKI